MNHIVVGLVALSIIAAALIIPLNMPGVTLLGNFSFESNLTGSGIPGDLAIWEGNSTNLSSIPIGDLNVNNSDYLNGQSASDIINTSQTPFASWLASPPNVSEFTNDAGYKTSESDPDWGAWLSSPPNISEFTNDYGYYNSTTLNNVSQLTNDVGYLTNASIPTNLSQFTNDMDYINSTYYQNVSQFTNDNNYYNSTTLENVSQLTNDAGYINATYYQNVSQFANDNNYYNNTTLNNVSQLTNDAGYLITANLTLYDQSLNTTDNVSFRNIYKKTPFGSEPTGLYPWWYAPNTIFDTLNNASIAGNITSVEIKMSNPDAGAKLKVFRNNGTDMIFVGESEVLNLVSGYNQVNLTQQIPVQIGDSLAIYQTSGVYYDIAYPTICYYYGADVVATIPLTSLSLINYCTLSIKAQISTPPLYVETSWNGNESRVTALEVENNSLWGNLTEVNTTAWSLGNWSNDKQNYNTTLELDTLYMPNNTGLQGIMDRGNTTNNTAQFFNNIMLGIENNYTGGIRLESVGLSSRYVIIQSSQNMSGNLIMNLPIDMPNTNGSFLVQNTTGDMYWDNTTYLTNITGFNVSDLINDAGYINITSVPTNLSQFTNDLNLTIYDQSLNTTDNVSFNEINITRNGYGSNPPSAINLMNSATGATEQPPKVTWFGNVYMNVPPFGMLNLLTKTIQGADSYLGLDGMGIRWNVSYMGTTLTDTLLMLLIPSTKTALVQQLGLIDQATGNIMTLRSSGAMDNLTWNLPSNYPVSNISGTAFLKSSTGGVWDWDNSTYLTNITGLNISELNNDYNYYNSTTLILGDLAYQNNTTVNITGGNITGVDIVANSLNLTTVLATQYGGTGTNGFFTGSGFGLIGGNGFDGNGNSNPLIDVGTGNLGDVYVSNGSTTSGIWTPRTGWDNVVFSNGSVQYEPTALGLAMGIDVGSTATGTDIGNTYVTSSGTFTLPNATTAIGKIGQIVCVRSDGTGTGLVLSPASGTIDNASSLTLAKCDSPITNAVAAVPYQICGVCVQSDGTNWWVISEVYNRLTLEEIVALMAE